MSPLKVANSLAEMESTIGWVILQQLMKQKIDDLTVKIIYSTSQPEIMGLAGEMRALMGLYSLPANIINGAIAQRAQKAKEEQEPDNYQSLGYDPTVARIPRNL